MQAEFARLKGLQAQRRTAIVIQSKIWRTIEAYVRVNVIGFSTFDDVDARAKACKEAEKIIKAAKVGEGEHDVVSLIVTSTEAAKPFDAMRLAAEKEMRKIARKSPLWQWAEGIRGLGDLGLAVILAEAGDPGKYSTVSKLWKRLGLAPIVKDGTTRAASSWRMKGGLNAEDWTNAGYNPKRRAEIYSCIDEPLFRQQSGNADKETGEVTKEAGPYRLVYDARRARTAETHPDWSKAQSHKDALRIMTKQLIADLWSEWRRAGHAMEPRRDLPASEESAQAGSGANGATPQAIVGLPRSDSSASAEGEASLHVLGAMAFLPHPTDTGAKPVRKRARSGQITSNRDVPVSEPIPSQDGASEANHTVPSAFAAVPHSQSLDALLEGIREDNLHEEIAA